MNLKNYLKLNLLIPKRLEILDNNKRNVQKFIKALNISLRQKIIKKRQKNLEENIDKLNKLFKKWKSR